MSLRPPPDHGVVRSPDRERAREHDRRVQDAPLGDLVDPDQLAEPVQDVRARVHALDPRQALVREHGRDAGPDGAPPVRRRVANDRRVSDAHAGDVGDGVALPGVRVPMTTPRNPSSCLVAPAPLAGTAPDRTRVQSLLLMAVLALGISHRRADVALLERLAFADDDLAKSYRRASDDPAIDGAVFVSTCNRVEVYGSVPSYHVGFQALKRVLCESRGVEPELLAEPLYSHYEADAAEHLFGVASGLDSMVLGEPQILSQVREALRRAESESATSAELHCRLPRGRAHGPPRPNRDGHRRGAGRVRRRGRGSRRRGARRARGPLRGGRRRRDDVLARREASPRPTGRDGPGAQPFARARTRARRTHAGESRGGWTSSRAPCATPTCSSPRPERRAWS